MVSRILQREAVKLSDVLKCRSCGSPSLTEVLSLGKTPLANALIAGADLAREEKTYPLDLVFCDRCTLLQITETISPDVLFSDYVYFSSFSETMLRHSQALVERLIPSEHLSPESLVIEVASNDGYLLQFYRNSGIPVLGVEPAANIAEVAIANGIPTVCEFFGSEVATRLRGEKRVADVIHANNVLAHVPDLNGFVTGIETLLADEGVAVIEAPYALDMIAGSEFDTIYHEHLCYFSLTALDALFRRNGLQIHDVEQVPIHGGSLRILASKSSSQRAVSQAVVDLLSREEAWGVRQREPYLAFGAQVDELKRTLAEMLSNLKGEGRRLAAYGASAKGSTLLNVFGIGRDTLDFVVDRSTVKQGRFTPGTHLPIRGPSALLEDEPDFVLLLTWNFADEILEQQAEFRSRGGKFIVPIPTPHII